MSEQLEMAQLSGKKVVVEIRWNPKDISCAGFEAISVSTIGCAVNLMRPSGI